MGRLQDGQRLLLFQSILRGWEISRGRRPVGALPKNLAPDLGAKPYGMEPISKRVAREMWNEQVEARAAEIAETIEEKGR